MNWPPLNVILSTGILLFFFVMVAWACDWRKQDLLPEFLEFLGFLGQLAVWFVIFTTLTIGASFVIVGGLALLTGQTH